jgi:hypothetical protein
MDFSEYIGFKLSDVKYIFESSNLDYEIKEVWDRKRTQIGEDLRVVNIVSDDKTIIYVAYF